jgi:hypothetical protein
MAHRRLDNAPQNVGRSGRDGPISARRRQVVGVCYSFMRNAA